MGVATASEVERQKWRRMERGVPGKHITFNGAKEWKKVAVAGAAGFSANKSPGAEIDEAPLRLAHIYLGYNLLGQGTCVARVSLTELYFMRRMQEGKRINLAFWLAYQVHQINRSKMRHLNLCHIVGVFMNRNIDLIHMRKGPQLEMCMIPRPFIVELLMENQIVRIMKGEYVFYESGQVNIKFRKKANLSQGQSKAKGQDEDDLIWIVEELHSQQNQVDKIQIMVEDVWKVVMAMKKKYGIVVEEPKKKSAEEGKQENEEKDAEKPRSRVRREGGRRE